MCAALIGSIAAFGGPLGGSVRGGRARCSTRSRAAARMSSALEATPLAGCASETIATCGVTAGPCPGPALLVDDPTGAAPGPKPRCSTRIASSNVKPCAVRKSAAMLRPSPTRAARTIAPSILARRPCLAASAAYCNISASAADIVGWLGPDPGARSLRLPRKPATSRRNRFMSIWHDFSTCAASSSSLSASRRCSTVT